MEKKQRRLMERDMTAGIGATRASLKKRSIAIETGRNKTNRDALLGENCKCFLQAGSLTKTGAPFGRARFDSVVARTSPDVETMGVS